MAWIFIGILAGLAAGLVVPYSFPAAYTSYVAMGLLAALDTIFGGVAAEMKGKFDTAIFVSGFFGNAALAMGLTFLGKRLGIDICLAVIVVFGTRLFNNFSFMRQHLLQKKPKGVKIKDRKMISPVVSADQIDGSLSQEQTSPETGADNSKKNKSEISK